MKAKTGSRRLGRQVRAARFSVCYRVWASSFLPVCSKEKQCPHLPSCPRPDPPRWAGGSLTGVEATALSHRGGWGWGGRQGTWLKAFLLEKEVGYLLAKHRGDSKSGGHPGVSGTALPESQGPGALEPVAGHCRREASCLSHSRPGVWALLFSAGCPGGAPSVWLRSQPLLCSKRLQRKECIRGVFPACIVVEI